MIANYGEAYTEKWAKGLVNNFSRKPQGNDRSQIIAVANNEADLAIANSYYLGLMLSGKKGDKQLNAGKKVKILFPSQNKNGTHINISGAGILKTSKNYSNAVKFLEFMLTENAQKPPPNFAHIWATFCRRFSRREPSLSLSFPVAPLKRAFESAW